MAFLKGLNNTNLKIKPKSVEQLFFDEYEDSKNTIEIYENYSYSVDFKSGNYKWFDDEFNLLTNESEDKLSIEIEYIPLILTYMRINEFMESGKRSMLSFLSTELTKVTNELINKESIAYTFDQSGRNVMLFIKKLEKDLYEHHIIVNFDGHDNYFDLMALSNEQKIKKFYSDLIDETNKLRIKILPTIIENMTQFSNNIIEKINVIKSQDIKDIRDKYFNIFDFDILEFIEREVHRTILDDLNEYIYYVKTNSYDEDSEFKPKVELDFLIEDMDSLEKELRQVINDAHIFNNSESEEVNYELYDEIEEELMEHMDKLISDEIIDEDDFIIEGKSIIESLQFVYDDIDAEKVEIERKILLNIINAYGISIINENFNLIQKIFYKLNLEEELEKLYEVSEDKKISDYKKWYNKLFELTGRNLKKEINN
ncbi:hypothetical protein [Geotoga petraea]|uniref:Uncharacterized protein n=1 Tax=Geotoga petraea TaxID=28234 RepID=A0A1G6HXZ3_9BACT|nr:hypothetical protein [Geotoga petraea]MDK2945354.1 hypothetical protein [Geotoga sp.]TGG89015.1 hypothetical protein E4650_02135 [Geotoga petraea]SDB99091.1 hypothetical protein SAMN04488588_0168 [Geotoga petraea]